MTRSDGDLVGAGRHRRLEVHPVGVDTAGGVASGEVVVDLGESVHGHEAVPAPGVMVDELLAVGVAQDREEGTVVKESAVGDATYSYS